MCADAGFHADQARRYIGEPRFHLATRPLLPQHDGAARIVAHDVERVLADIDADHDDRSIGCLRHGGLLVFGAPCQLRLLAGQEHGRTIPLAEIRRPIILPFLHSAILLLRSSCSWIGYGIGLATGGKNEAINRVVGVANNWVLSWKHWNGECRSLLPIRWLSCQLRRTTRGHSRTKP